METNLIPCEHTFMDPQQSNDQKTQEAVDTLESFFSLIDSGSLLNSTDHRFYRGLRREVRGALSHLLLWGRPILEASKGLSWPYEQLKKRYHSLEGSAQRGSKDFQGNQALLFLALLPFPEQWSWLLRAEELLRDNKELDAFLAKEQQKVSEKLESRSAANYKLRHFCQVLKPPQDGAEKGVLRIHSMPYLFAPTALSKLSRRYLLYVEPPQGVVCRYTWLRAFSMLEDPCVMGVGSSEDMDFLKSQPQIEPIPLAHGDYLLDSVEVPLDRKKEYDIVFNARFDELPRKRHQLMLELLQHRVLADTKALFLGLGDKQSVDHFLGLVHEIGLGDRVTVVANIPRSEVPGHLSLCKLGVHLSLYENCCRCVYEFFRSDLPCVVSSSMGGMNLEIFNSHTGMSAKDSELPRAISFVLNNRDQFAPRRWFLENSGSSRSTDKLNRYIRGLFSKLGYPWQEDIVPLQSGGPSRYVSTSDYDRFRNEFFWIKDCLTAKGELPIKISVD